MQKISINNKSLNYGITIDDIFWIKNNIIRKEKLRSSQDEEVIADLVAWSVLDEGLRSSSDILDQLYDYNIESSISGNVETQIQKIGMDTISENIQYVFDFIIDLVDKSNSKDLNSLLFLKGKDANISRNFQILFYSLYKLLIIDDLKVGNLQKVIKTLSGSGEKITNLAGGGGKWSQKEKQTQTDALVGVLRKDFIEKDANDVSRNQWITRFENILTQSSTEQTMYDFKCGIYNITSDSDPNINSISNIIKTLLAMANTMPKSLGYCIIGVADSTSTAQRHKNIYGANYISFSNFYITGVQDEAKKHHGNIDKYFTRIIQLIHSEPISDRDKDYLLRHIKTIKYFDKDIIILEMLADKSPSIYGEDYYVRHGSNVQKVEPKNFNTLYQRFQNLQ